VSGKCWLLICQVMRLDQAQLGSDARITLLRAP